MCNQGQTGQLSLHTRVPYLLQSSYLKMMIHYKFSCQTHTCWLKERCWKKLGVTFLTSLCTYNVANGVRTDWLQWCVERFCTSYIQTQYFLFYFDSHRCVQHVQFSSPASLCLIRSCWVPIVFPLSLQCIYDLSVTSVTDFSMKSPGFHVSVSCYFLCHVLSVYLVPGVACSVFCVWRLK